MPEICEMGQDDFYFLSEGRRVEDFFRPEIFDVFGQV
jgi:hypothetical protein